MRQRFAFAEIRASFNYDAAVGCTEELKGLSTVTGAGVGCFRRIATMSGLS